MRKTKLIAYSLVVLIIVSYFLIVNSSNKKESEEFKPIWKEIFGGKNEDNAFFIQQTNDEGFIIIGYTEPYGSGDKNIWLIKTDSNGKKQWDKTFGGDYDEEGYSVQQTSEGGYIIIGATNSSSPGNNDIWLIKINSLGKMEWNKTYGGRNNEWGMSVQEVDDNGYVIIGNTKTYGEGGWDIWLFKINNTGIIEWNRTYGGTNDDWCYSAQQTSDGGNIITGYTSQFDSDTFGRDNSSILLIKINSSGIIQWNTTFNVSSVDKGHFVQQTSDGGFIVTGGSDSYSSRITDLLLLKTDENGNEQWCKIFSEGSFISGHSVCQTTNNTYVVVGQTNKEGNLDIILLKIDSQEDNNESSVDFFPWISMQFFIWIIILVIIVILFKKIFLKRKKIDK